MSEEVWKPVVSYEGLYSVSSEGRIRNDVRMSIRKPFLNEKTGYLGIHLTHQWRVRYFSVHCLVADAFLGFEPDLTVNHKNGIKTDNRLDNLEWKTQSENQLHAYELGLQKPTVHSQETKDRMTIMALGEGNNAAILTEEDVIDIRRRYSEGGIYQKELAREYNVTQQTISDIIRGKSWYYIPLEVG